MTCPECKLDFPADLINPLVTNEGTRLVRPMCPICALHHRNMILGLPLDSPFEGRVARGMYNAATVHLARTTQKGPDA